MAPFAQKARLKSAILHICESAEHLVAFDSLYNLYFLDRQSFEATKSVQLFESEQGWHPFSKPFDANIKGHIAFGIAGTNEVIVSIIGNGGTITEIARLQDIIGNIETLKYSPNGEYLALGSTEGRTLIYECGSYKQITALMTRPDYISSVSFSANSSLVCVSGFDKHSTIFDIDRNVYLAFFTTASVVTASTFFDNDNSIFYICQDQISAVFGLSQKITLVSSRNFSSWPTVLEMTDDGKYAVVGTKSDNLHLICLEDNEKKASTKLTNAGISALKLLGQKLLIGFSNGMLMGIDFYADLSQLENALAAEEYEIAAEIIKKNVLLPVPQKILDAFNSGYKNRLNQAIDAMLKNDLSTALSLVKPFLGEVKRQAEFNFLLSQKDKIATLYRCIEDKDITKAYYALRQNPFLEKLKVHGDLEELWNRAFNTAKKVLEEQGDKNSAMEFLRPFQQVEAKKNAIFNLMNNFSKFSEADAAVKSRMFKQYFMMLEAHPYLKEADTYKKTLSLGQQMLKKADLLQKEKKFTEAKTLIKVVLEFLPIQSGAIKELQTVEAKEQFMGYFEADDAANALKLADSHHEVRELPEYEQLLKRFKERLKKAYEYANQGFSKKVAESLKDYTTGNYAHKVESVMRIAHLNELKGANFKDGSSWAKATQKYVKLYGKDDGLKKVCDEKKIRHLYEMLDAPKHETATALFLGSILE